MEGEGVWKGEGPIRCLRPSHSLGRTVSWSNDLKKHFVLWFFPEKVERFIWFFCIFVCTFVGGQLTPKLLRKGTFSQGVRGNLE